MCSQEIQCKCFAFCSAGDRADLPSPNRQIVGILAALDRFILQGKEQGNEFLMRTLQKQYQKSTTALERACVRLPFSPFIALTDLNLFSNSQKEQIKSIEQTKLTLKKRKGVVPFVRVFPVRIRRSSRPQRLADSCLYTALRLSCRVPAGRCRRPRRAERDQLELRADHRHHLRVPSADGQD